MIRLVVRLAGTNVVTGVDEDLARVESDQYDADILDALIPQCLAQALRGRTVEAVKATRPMIAIGLSADEADSGRPSFHLSRETISRMAEVGAAFDFDPYVYP